jgi:hypothetical protein
MEDKNGVIDEKDTLDLSLEEKETTEEKKEERTVPLQALQEERKKRQELETRLSALEESASKPSTSDKSSNPDIETAANALDPYLRQKGFLTREQLEEEKQAESYANEMKDLTKKFDGKDGRPTFDAYEVSEFGKKNRIFNLEVAYKTMHEKELIDWNMKQGDKSEAPETEKSGSSGIKQTGNTSILTRESLKVRLAKPDGREWWEKNRDKVFAAMQKGEIS